MPDEKYSIVVDYVAKNGKLPIATLPPQVIVSPGKSGSSGGLKETILTAVVSSVMGGITGAFMKTKAPMKFPKASRTPSKANDIVRENIKLTNKNKELKSQLNKTQVNLRNTKERLASKRDTLEKKKEQLRESEVMKDIVRQENISMRRERDALQKEVDLNKAYSQRRTQEESNEILQKSINRQQISDMHAQARKERTLTTEEKFSQVTSRSMEPVEQPPSMVSNVAPRNMQPISSIESKVADFIKEKGTITTTDLSKEITAPPVIPQPLFEEAKRKISPKEEKTTYQRYDNEEGNRRVYKQDSLNERTQ